MIEKQVK